METEILGGGMRVGGGRGRHRETARQAVRQRDNKTEDVLFGGVYVPCTCS